jgi:hypothetical protein
MEIEVFGKPPGEIVPDPLIAPTVANPAKVPPFIVTLFSILLSTDNEPELIVTPPEKLFVLFILSVPDPFLMMLPDPVKEPFVTN